MVGSVSCGSGSDLSELAAEALKIFFVSTSLVSGVEIRYLTCLNRNFQFENVSTFFKIFGFQLVIFIPFLSYRGQRWLTNPKKSFINNQSSSGYFLPNRRGFIEGEIDPNPQGFPRVLPGGGLGLVPPNLRGVALECARGR